MHMPEIQSVLKEKSISFSYVEEDNCGSIDFEHRGLRYHIWEYADEADPVGVETNLRYAGRDEDESILTNTVTLERSEPI